MKRVFCGMAVPVCCLLWILPVRADMLIEPMDLFYEQHSSECSYVGRQFTANGPDGKVIVYKSPKLPEVVDVWENGREVYIQFAYEDEDGIAWGIYDADVTGWMPMDYLELIYDSISFQEDYGDEIKDETGSLDREFLNQEIRFWRYPGAEAYECFLASSYVPDYRLIYTDEAGNRWGRIGYYFGIRDMWVCIDAPTAAYDELYPDGVSPTEKDREKRQEENAEREGRNASDRETSADRIVPKPDDGMIVLTIALVLLTAAATAGLLVLFRKKGSGD
ncbi:MAG: hypothetical protein HFH93_05465 [Lachnospiraceae bacterium]|nr:hypothetical protein [Lachnospiraceae bacterium]